jgi:hypothetical protein
MQPWWIYWTGPAVMLQLLALLFFLAYLRHRVPPKYERLGLRRLAYFDHPYQQARIYPKLDCTGHLGVVALLPTRWLMRLRSCRDLDRAAHLALFTTGERLGAALFVAMAAASMAVELIVTVVRIVMRVAGL